MLRTLSQMVGFDQYPTILIESEHNPRLVSMHAQAEIFHLPPTAAPGASQLIITFDNIPIGYGAVYVMPSPATHAILAHLKAGECVRHSTLSQKVS